MIRWPPGRLAATLVHKFRFDGIVYDRCIDTTAGALPFRIDLQVLGEKNPQLGNMYSFFLFQDEFPKMALIWQLISGEREDFPEDAINQEEKVTFNKITLFRYPNINFSG